LVLANPYYTILNNYYDKIYVISVEAATDRRQKFETNFAGLEFDFFFGADKSKFNIDDVIADGTYDEKLARMHHRYHKAMKHGEIACSISHRMVFEDMLKNNYQRALIFEDDALPDTVKLNSIPLIIEQLPPDCEMLMWGWSKNGNSNMGTMIKQGLYQIQRRAGKLNMKSDMIRNLYAKPFSSHLKKAGFHDYAHAYGITRSAAEKLVALQTPVQYIADNLLAHAATRNIIKAYIAFPPIILHDNLPDGTHRDSYIR
jgi:glycosyl transferase family 25